MQNSKKSLSKNFKQLLNLYFRTKHDLFFGGLSCTKKLNGNYPGCVPTCTKIILGHQC